MKLQLKNPIMNNGVYVNRSLKAAMPHSSQRFFGKETMKRLVMLLAILLNLCQPLVFAAQQPEFLNDFDRKVDQFFRPRNFFNYRVKAKVGGQSRYRYEYRDDLTLNNTAYEDDHMHLLRNRLNLDVSYLSETGAVPARFFVEGQEAHAFTESAVNKSNIFVNEVDLRQLYVEVKSPFKKLPMTAKVGRQVLSYGDERYVGGLEWTNTARVFDALKLVINPNPQFILDVFASNVVKIEKEKWDQGTKSDDFYGIYLSTKPWKKSMDHVLDTFLFIRHNSDESVLGERRRGRLKEYTFGNRFKGKKYNWDYGTEYAVQVGSRSHDEIQAWSFHQELGYTFSKWLWTPRLYGEYNHASGDRNPSDGKFQTFDNLYPTNHNKYGFIDLFSLKNINDWMIGTSIKPHQRLLLSSDYHWFVLDAKESAWFNVAGAGGTVRGANANADPHVGSELDLLATYQLTARLGLLAGYSHFFAGPFVKDTGAHDDANLFYIQSTLNF